MIMKMILKINQSECSLMLEWFLADKGQGEGIKGSYRVERSLKYTMCVKVDLGE